MLYYLSSTDSSYSGCEDEEEDLISSSVDRFGSNLRITSHEQLLTFTYTDFTSDSPPSSPPPPELPDVPKTDSRLNKLETESTDTGLPSSHPASCTDLDLYSAKYNSHSNDISPEDNLTEDGLLRHSAFCKYTPPPPPPPVSSINLPPVTSPKPFSCQSEQVSPESNATNDYDHDRLYSDNINPYAGNDDCYSNNGYYGNGTLRHDYARDRLTSDGAAVLKPQRPSVIPQRMRQLSGSKRNILNSLSYEALSPKPCPQSRGYATSMPFLDADNRHNTIERGHSLSRPKSPMSDCSRTTNTSRVSLARRAMHNSHQQSHSRQASSEQIDLPYLIQLLSTSTNPRLIATTAGCIQHLAFNQDHMKHRIRDMGGIPLLTRYLQSDDDVICVSVLGALRNLSYGHQNNLNKIAIKDAHGVPLLIQLLKSSHNFEILELVTGVFWNLSSSEQLKPQILKQALEPLVNTVIVPQSGWTGSQVRTEKVQNIDCTTVFRNATGCLRNLSSVGQEGRQLMRICPALVDSLLFTLRSVQGKNDVDNKAVENSVCVLRNLSYKLDEEVSAQHKYGQVEDWRSKGLGGGQFRQKNPEEDGCFKRKKGAKKQRGKENITPLPEHTSGIGLLWQPATVRVYLDLLLECSNPETLEGAAGALQNLTASNWQAGQVIREAVRKEKGLAVITSLLRMHNDNVIRATAICLRNLSSDPKNKALLGENALPDIVRRLPGADGFEGVTDVTIGALLSALHELLQNAPDSCKTFKDIGGITRLMDIIRNRDSYSTQCIVMCQKILRTLYDVKELRKHLKHVGWSLAMLQNMPNMDRTDGLEYDESRNQFKTSYNGGLDHNHQNTISRGGRYPLSPGLDRRVHTLASPYQQQQHPHPHHSNYPEYLSPPVLQKQELYIPHRAATIGRSFDPSLEYHKPDRDIPRGQSLPGGRHLQSCNTSFGVADSWV